MIIQSCINLHFIGLLRVEFERDMLEVDEGEILDLQLRVTHLGADTGPDVNASFEVLIIAVNGTPPLDASEQT